MQRTLVKGALIHFYETCASAPPKKDSPPSPFSSYNLENSGGERMQKMFHLSVKIFSRGKGHNFRQKLAYRDGGIYVDEFTGQRVNYLHKGLKDQIENDFITPSGADESLCNRNDYYDALEKKEKAKNAQFFREFEIALPDDMSKEDKKIVARKFGNELAKQGMFVDINYHKLDSKNPHAHILTSMRGVNENGLLGNKNREWNDKQKIEEWRSTYAKVINEHYATLGKKNSVNHQSYKKQGKNKIATKKLPVDKKSKDYQDRLKLNKDIKKYNKVTKLKDYKKDLETLQQQRTKTKTDLSEVREVIEKYPHYKKIREERRELKSKALQTHMQIKKREIFLAKNQDLVKSKTKDKGLSI